MSLETRIDTALIPEEHMHGPVWEAFVNVMEDKQYGPGPSSQAWHFFRDGWLARQAYQPGDDPLEIAISGIRNLNRKCSTHGLAAALLDHIEAVRNKKL